jgi:hypothetical protein
MGQDQQDSKPENSNKTLKPITIILTGCKNVGKSTIFKQFEFLFWDQKVKTVYSRLDCSNDEVKLFFKNHCRENIIIHFKSVLEIFEKNSRPTYDTKTEEILNSILGINMYFFNINLFWTSDVVEVILRISQEEKFQEILKNRHKYDIGDSTEYLLKRTKYFDEQSSTTRMDYMRYFFNTFF